MGCNSSKNSAKRPQKKLKGRAREESKDEVSDMSESKFDEDSSEIESRQNV